MPVEQTDNTRVELSPRINPLKPIKVHQIGFQKSQNQDQLYDTDKIEKYRNMQNFYNNNFFGYGVGGVQTNYNPRTPQGQAAIQANYDYAKSNMQNVAESLITVGVARGAGQAFKWATTPTKIGSGAEAVVKSAPASTRVTKITTIPRSEMHTRNMVPGALKSRYVRTSKGLNTYTQPKVHILSKKQLEKATKHIERFMRNRGWQRVTHPNLQGLGFTNGRQVISDLGPGNVGRDLLGRPRFVDFIVQSKPQFLLDMQKQGGKLRKD